VGPHSRHGITQTLPRLVPIDVAKELTFSGRIVSGSEAVALGLVTRNSDDPLPRRWRWQTRSRRNLPMQSVRKRLYDQTWSVTTPPLPETRIELQSGLIGQPIRSPRRGGMSGEQPVFVDPD